MKNLFEIITNICLKKCYTVTVLVHSSKKEQVYNNRCIYDAINLCNDFKKNYRFCTIHIFDNKTDEILYVYKSSKGNVPKATVVYTYNVIFDHLAELLKQKMEF